MRKTLLRMIVAACVFAASFLTVNRNAFAALSNGEGRTIDPMIIGDWEYEFTQFDTRFSFYKSGYCFYEDGTGLDIFWDLPFTYFASDGILEIQYDDPEYPAETIKYSFNHLDQINGIGSSEGFELLVFHHEGIDNDGDAFFHIPEDVFDLATIEIGRTESWDHLWSITSEDGKYVTLEFRSNYYGLGEDIRVIPAVVNGHPVNRVNNVATMNDELNSAIIPEGIAFIGSRAIPYNKIHFLSLPDSLEYMAEDAFYEAGAHMDDSHNLILLVHEGSYAESYANAHNMEYRIITEETPEEILAYVDSLGESTEIIQEPAVEESRFQAPNFYVKINSSEGSVNFRTGPGRDFPVVEEVPN